MDLNKKILTKNNSIVLSWMFQLIFMKAQENGSEPADNRLVNNLSSLPCTKKSKFLNTTINKLTLEL